MKQYLINGPMETQKSAWKKVHQNQDHRGRHAVVFRI